MWVSVCETKQVQGTRNVEHGIWTRPVRVHHPGVTLLEFRHTDITSHSHVTYKPAPLAVGCKRRGRGRMVRVNRPQVQNGVEKKK